MNLFPDNRFVRATKESLLLYMGHKDDGEGYCHFCAHCYTVGLQEVFSIKMERIFF